jgi:hypothetical protein
VAAVWVYTPCNTRTKHTTKYETLRQQTKPDTKTRHCHAERVTHSMPVFSCGTRACVRVCVRVCVQVCACVCLCRKVICIQRKVSAHNYHLPCFDVSFMAQGDSPSAPIIRFPQYRRVPPPHARPLVSRSVGATQGQRRRAVLASRSMWFYCSRKDSGTGARPKRTEPAGPYL